MHHIVVHVMAQNTTADDRTDTKCFENTVTGDELIEGDRISKRLVAQSLGQLGQPWQPDGPETQLVTVTDINSMDDTHTALIADPESGALFRAGRHDRQQAVSQKEADWKVRDIGTTIVVETVHELELASSDDPVDDEAEYIEEWAQLLFDDARNGYDDYSDERKLNGRTLTLRDVDGRKAMATISLED